MIEVNNLSAYRISKKFLKEIAEAVLKRENKKTELSVALVDEKRMKELNGRYRKKDKPTDVLSFSYGRSGEIVICPGVLERNAEEYRSSFKKELARVLIHGILHVLGYSHKGMAQKQISYLKLFLK